MSKLSEIDALAQASRIIHEEVLRKGIFNETTLKDIRDHFEGLISEDIKRGRVSYLKSGLVEMLRDLPHMTSVPEQRRIFALVEQETGLRMVDFIDRDSARLKAILARGRIRGEADYRLVRSHVDVLEGDPGQAAALEEAYRLIGEFETRLTKTPRR